MHFSGFTVNEENNSQYTLKKQIFKHQEKCLYPADKEEKNLPFNLEIILETYIFHLPFFFFFTDQGHH